MEEDNSGEKTNEIKRALKEDDTNEIRKILENGDDEYNKKLSEDGKIIAINRSKEYRKKQRVSEEQLTPRKSNKNNDKDKSKEQGDEDPRS